MKNKIAQILYAWAVRLNPAYAPATYEVTRTIQKQYERNGVVYTPMILKDQVTYEPSDILKDPLHHQRAIGLMLHNFNKHISKECLTVKVESFCNTEVIKAQLVIMVPEESYRL